MKVINIGRSQSNDVVINDDYVGRTHMQIIVDDHGSVYAVDLNSRNGTFVNGVRIMGQVRLNTNDIIRIGKTDLPWRNYVGVPSYTPTPPGRQSHNNRNKGNSGCGCGIVTIVVVAVVLFLLILIGGITWYFVWRANNYGNTDVNMEYSNPIGEFNIPDEPVGISIPSDSKPYGRNTKPSISEIMYDLIGHKLSEGVTDGYHPSDWTYEIEDNSVSDFSIVETIRDNDNEYVIVASMRLKGGKNYYYDTRAKIIYSNPGDGWTFNNVLSLGMNVVSDGQYDDCVVTSIVDDGWGGVNCLGLNNISECTLIVGGKVYTTANGWMKFSHVIGPHESGNVGGTFGGGNVQDYVIDFIVRKE